MRFFVRNDDVGDLTAELVWFVDAFIERRIPVSHQVIPANLTPECATYLRDKADRHPDLVGIGQHGFRHYMVINGIRHWREFGPERSFEEQKRDVIAGKVIMENLFGSELSVSVFTPPQHKYNGDTVRAVFESGFRIFSGSCYMDLLHQTAYKLGRTFRLGSFGKRGVSYHGEMRPEAPIAELSISIAADNGSKICISSDKIGGALARAPSRFNPVGIMFHHSVYSGEDGRASLESIVGEISTITHGRFVGMTELLAVRSDKFG
jgi:hypothetical protein